jgi:hypothetical protein
MLALARKRLGAIEADPIELGGADRAGKRLVPKTPRWLEWNVIELATKSHHYVCAILLQPSREQADGSLVFSKVSVSTRNSSRRLARAGRRLRRLTAV